MQAPGAARELEGHEDNDDTSCKILSSVAQSGNLHKDIIATARTMMMVTPSSSFVAIMQ